MRAVVFDRYGPPDVLRFADLPDPEPGPGEVLVKVRAAGVQPFDVAVRTGRMPWVRADFPQRIGQEYVGVVIAGDLAPGTPVLGSTMLNAVAEYVTVPAGNVVVKPDHLDFPTAAGLVAASQTASGALIELAVTEGDVLLLHAAAGSVGTIATQLAVRAGATVIGTASPGNHEYLRELGAVPVPYGMGLIDAVRATGLTPTVALDAAGGEAIGQSVGLGIAPDRVGTIVDDKAAAEHGARVVRAGRSPQRLAEVVALPGLRMPIRAFGWERVAEAHAVVESRHGRGKVVVTVDQG
ncbi:putative alcohol dehydrogenase [Actinoplanes missouriensis 431]|uniref:Putative alcohol dehydrogenase n=1 Tax=Actinoplanes missouriensis (strain ATCC 14538 / DSM 43046 / CBS 188.64 / JCM 3121 / NBRC 102363 / NCIMB 12654 / NRRL B-3342 / UNCC 431) TaxID=512565 RepID=I0HFK4_ACTM4|nr:NADP-dependent oxidoreductase [Actinoplanes missouriensis]BAL91791.1 putative alcohol dehydrogenase [Actinoplanes missouriensis 431]